MFGTCITRCRLRHLLVHVGKRRASPLSHKCRGKKCADGLLASTLLLLHRRRWHYFIYSVHYFDFLLTVMSYTTFLSLCNASLEQVSQWLSCLSFLHPPLPTVGRPTVVALRDSRPMCGGVLFVCFVIFSFRFLFTARVSAELSGCSDEVKWWKPGG